MKSDLIPTQNLLHHPLYQNSLTNSHFKTTWEWRREKREFTHWSVQTTAGINARLQCYRLNQLPDSLLTENYLRLSQLHKTHKKTPVFNGIQTANYLRLRSTDSTTQCTIYSSLQHNESARKHLFKQLSSHVQTAQFKKSNRHPLILESFLTFNLSIKILLQTYKSHYTMTSLNFLHYLKLFNYFNTFKNTSVN